MVRALLTCTDELLIQLSTLYSRPQAIKRNVRSLSNWFNNTGNAILDEEAAYIDHTYDLIPLVPKPITGLRQLLERSSRFRFSRLWKKAPPGDTNLSFADVSAIHYSSDARIDGCVGITITILGMIMLIAPLWGLAITEGMMQRLGVITGFIVLFLALIAFTTVARPFESLAAAAA